MKPKHNVPLLSALLLVLGSAAQGADALPAGRPQPAAGRRLIDLVQADADVPGRVVDLPLAGYQLWPSLAPADCPFPPSPSLSGVFFTGVHSDYHVGDTFYPSWASDGNQYSPWTDGSTDGVSSHSFWLGKPATTGNAVMIGDDPLKLQIKNTSTPQEGAPEPYTGRYPAGSLVHNGIWYYGTYCLGPAGFVEHGGFTYNWPVLGPMPGFRISKDYGKTWTPSPLSPAKPLFPEPAKHLGTVKMGAPHFVDFGKNMEHSPDGKAYLLGMGAEENDAKPRFANLSWISADQVYLARVTPRPETINDLKAYEFFAGHDAAGKPVWTADFGKIRPLLDWNNHMGCVTATYVPGLKKYLMCVTNGWPTTGKMHSYILEADQLTGPWRLVTYMKDFGEQAYFLNFPSKFISADGKRLWLCYSANFAAEANGQKLKFNPPGGRYGLCLHEVRLLKPDEKVTAQTPNPFDAKNNVARQAKVKANSEWTGFPVAGAIDGRPGGYPNVNSEEWASGGWKEGATLTLTWDKPQTVDRVWLVDRPNPLDQVLACKLTFSDGTSVDVSTPLPDDGTKALEVVFPPKTTSTLTFTTTKVKESTNAIGLSEIGVFTAKPGSAYPAKKVDSGRPNPFDAKNNIARQAKVKANSEWTGFPVAGAIDGRPGGYPNVNSEEWASGGWKEGATLTLTWDKPQTVDRVWLVDRPNPLDQVLACKLTFSDGTSVDVSTPLPDDGTKALEVVFPPKTTSTLTFTTTKVKESTNAIGLSEIGVFTRDSGETK